MIFHFEDEFTHNCDPRALSDVCSLLIANHHYIIVNSRARKDIRSCIVNYGSKSQQENFQRYKGFLPNNTLKQYMTTIEVNATFSLLDLNYLAKTKGIIIVENRNKEWPTYKDLIKIYCHDKTYGFLFSILDSAVIQERIDASNAGGFGEIIETSKGFDYISLTSGKNLAQLKIMGLFDRDTTGPTTFDPKYDNTFLYYSDKDSNTISNNDIYTLNQPRHSWHMWYKREIENYFPDAQLIANGIDASVLLPPENRDYYPFGKNKPKGYFKNKLPNLVKGLTLSEFERGQQHFLINGKDTSEFELFLLKLVKLI